MKTTKKILVVDDDAGISEMLKTLLEFSGYQVAVTQSAAQTQSQVENGNVDLVVLDMLISGVDGTEVCADLRQNKKTSNVPILMMSAHQEAGEKCLEAGADDFIAKPFEMEDFLLKVNRVMEGARG